MTVVSTDPKLQFELPVIKYAVYAVAHIYMHQLSLLYLSFDQFCISVLKQLMLSYIWMADLIPVLCNLAAYPMFTLTSNRII